MAKRRSPSHRLDRKSSPSLRNWQEPAKPHAEQMASNGVVEMGWGRLVFGHTFESNERLLATLRREEDGARDIALYLRDPHVLLAQAPHELFLDPSHTYRLWSHDYRPAAHQGQPFTIRRLRTRDDAEAVNRIYSTRRMVPCDPSFMLDQHATRLRTYLVAQAPADPDSPDAQVVGTVTGVDHVEAFDDPENGSSLWCLAVDPQAHAPGVGEALVRHLVEHYFARGRAYVDLSVLHDNTQAIRLYEKLGFQRVPVFCIKRKNPINEPLFTPPRPGSALNPYAGIIVDEARRRGIGIEVLEPEFGYFKLKMGGRTVACRESLTELTSAVAMSLCDDKRLTHRVLRSAGLTVPSQCEAADEETNREFLEDCGSVVVKPARGEQGAGVHVDVRDPQGLEASIEAARRVDPEVILEEYIEGEDLRVILIDYDVVAAAVRRPPAVTGTGHHTLTQLIEKYNRRRQAATGGESRVPLDAETARCAAEAGYGLDEVLPADETLVVRKTANLHTGGTIHDVTADLHPRLAEAAVEAARALDIPVVGLDLLVPDVSGPDYVIVEANERPGLANHEPQPTAQRFMDLLFPQTATARP